MTRMICMVAMVTLFNITPVLFAAESSKSEIVIAAAASLKNVFDKKIIPGFTKKTGIKVLGVYDSSGRLQTQIENGLDPDVFMSAAVTQMNSLVKGRYINASDVIPLLENKLVLIKLRGAKTKVTGFANITDAGSIALGDPRSVPAGQYAREAFIKIGNWKTVEVSKNLSLGTNVTEVLNWVASGAAETGVVYATDAASQKKVEVIAVLEDGILTSPVIYPLAPLAKSKNKDLAITFVEYISSDNDVRAAFKEYGFSDHKR